MAQEFDYIVVGGGSAGCVVASRLSESGHHSVALLEAGGNDDNFWIHAPLGYGKLYDDPKFNWLYEAEADARFGDKKLFQPRGKVLGGTGSINGLLYVRGQRQDFDLWSALGNDGWSYEELLPYFKKSEDHERGANEFHGAGGPVAVSYAPRHELADAFIEAAIQAGFPRNDDFNGATQEGFGYNQLTIRNGRRSSTAVGYLRPARRRSNLSVFVHSLVTRILFRRGHAVGVEFYRDGKSQSVSARREVILCCGAFNSPQLLQLSGVGPAELLTQYDLPVVADLPGVGENLQDHISMGTSYRCTKPITLSDILNNPVRRIAMGVRYLLFHSGVMAANATVCGGCIRTDPILPSPDVKINLQLWNRATSMRSKQTLGLAGYSSFSIGMMMLHPENSGYVRIKSVDPRVQPEIRFNYFVSERDQNAAVETVKIIRRIMSMPAISSYVEEEEKPGRNRISDSDIRSYCFEAARSSFHPSGSCKMGADEKAVVDHRLRVHSLEGLRVADASIMPRIVSGNTNAASIMIGEKAAAMVLEDAR